MSVLTSINRAIYNLPRNGSVTFFCGVWIDYPNQTWTDGLWKVRYSAGWRPVYLALGQQWIVPRIRYLCPVWNYESLVY